MHKRFITVLTHLSKPAVSIGGAVVLGALAVAAAWSIASISPAGKTMSVTTGPITEEVDVTGVVKAAHSTDLAFQTSGRVAAIRVQVGDHVGVGQTLVALDGSSQAAALALAKANLEAAQAKLNALESGTRPEQLAINQTAVAQAQNALASALTVAYTNADDAVHAKADQLFTNPRNATAQLTIVVPDSALVNRVQAERVALEPMLVSWQSTLASVGQSADLTTVSEANLKSVGAFLNDLTTALSETQPGGSLSSASLISYQTSTNAGRLNVSASLSALIAADTAYKASVGALTLAQAGATENDINAQKAAVDAAQAAVDAAQASASQAVIVAPVSGVITAQNANLGETVVPGVPLVSLIADGKYQADAQISEADIAKVKAGDTVEAAFAAYSGVQFAATVTTVNPAATMQGGVASYGVTVTFSKDDPRLLPGLSANLHIITATKDASLLIPASAVITDGNQQFVYVKSAKGVVRAPVTTGVRSADGMIEITSGIIATDEILSL